MARVAFYDLIAPMKPIKGLCLNPTGRKVCYTKLPKTINELSERLLSEGYDLSKLRFNLSSDFDTVISGPLTNDTFSLYGETYSGKTYVTNVSLNLEELKNTSTTIETIKKNISW